MLDNYFKLPESGLGKHFKYFIAALDLGRFPIRRDFSLVFLCGANKEELIPSERRTFLKNAIEKHLPHARIVYAEKVMEELTKHGKTKNLLDIEHQISAIADWILIILESFSSFCELGAFAHQSSRKKLIVINDSHFQKQPSFINHGPIQAISEDAGTDRIAWYPMSPNGIFSVDAIGMTLPSIVKILSKRKIKDRMDKELFLPGNATQSALFFLHDILYLCGPLTHAETIVVYKKIFGEHLHFDEVKSLRGILHACNLIEAKNIDGAPTYISKNSETFIDFGPWTNKLLSAFRRYHLKFNPLRLVNG